MRYVILCITLYILALLECDMIYIPCKRVPQGTSRADRHIEPLKGYIANSARNLYRCGVFPMDYTASYAVFVLTA